MYMASPAVLTSPTHRTKSSRRFSALQESLVKEIGVSHQSDGRGSHISRIRSKFMSATDENNLHDDTKSINGNPDIQLRREKFSSAKKVFESLGSTPVKYSAPQVLQKPGGLISPTRTAPLSPTNTSSFSSWSTLISEPDQVERKESQTDSQTSSNEVSPLKSDLRGRSRNSRAKQKMPRGGSVDSLIRSPSSEREVIIIEANADGINGRTRASRGRPCLEKEGKDRPRPHISEIISTFEKRSRSTDRNDNYQRRNRSKQTSPNKGGPIHRPPTPAAETKSYRPASLVAVNNENSDVGRSTASVVANKYLEAINKKLSDKAKHSAITPSPPAKENSHHSVSSRSDSSDSVFVSGYQSTPSTPAPAVLSVTSTPLSALPSGVRPPVNSLASDNQPLTVNSPGTMSTMVSERLNKLGIIESQQAEKTAQPPLRRSSSSSINSTSSVGSNITRDISYRAAVRNHTLQDRMSKFENMEGSSKQPNNTPSKNEENNHHLARKISSESNNSHDQSTNSMEPPDEPSPTIPDLQESKHDEPIKDGHYQTPRSIPKDSLALKTHNEALSGHLSLESDSFLEKSAMSQQSPLTNSIFKALGLQDSYTPDSSKPVEPDTIEQAYTHQQEVDGSFSASSVSKEEDTSSELYSDTKHMEKPTEETNSNDSDMESDDDGPTSYQVNGMEGYDEDEISNEQIEQEAQSISSMSDEDHADGDSKILTDDKGLYYYEVPGLPGDPSSEEGEEAENINYHPATRVSFSTAPIPVFLTHSTSDYDRCNDDVDPVSASAEYELEKRVELMDLFDVELEKGPSGLGLSIIGMGVGADAGLEKLGIFIKTITPNGAAFLDGRIKVNDQIIEVNGNSLVGVTQAYAGGVLRNTDGMVYFKIGREKEGTEDSEVARLIQQSLAQEKMDWEQTHGSEDGQSDENGPDESWRYDGMNDGRVVDTSDEDLNTEELDQALSHVQVFDLPEEEKIFASENDEEYRSKIRELFIRQQVTDAEIKQLREKVEEQNGEAKETREDLDRTKNELENAKEQVTLLDKKYNKAKKLIKEFQQREGEFLKREANLKMQITTMEKMNEIEKNQLEQQIKSLEKKLANHPSNSGLNRNNSNRSNGPHSPMQSVPTYQQHQNKYFPNVDNATPTVTSTDGTPAPEKRPSVRQTFDNLIASLDDMLDSRADPNSDAKYGDASQNASNHLDNSALKYRAKLKGPRFNKSSSRSDSDNWEEKGAEGLEQLHGSPLSKRGTPISHGKQHINMSPLPQSSPMGDVPSPSTSPSSKVRMRRIVNVDDNNVAMGNSDGDKKTRAHGGARPHSAASTISGVSSHSDEGSVEKRGQTQGELYLSTPTWSVDDVVAWMSGCGLTLHVATFNQHKIDGAKLMAIDNDRLKEMGIVDKSEKNLLKRKVKELKTRYEKERKLADKLNKKQKKGFRTGKKPLF